MFALLDVVRFVAKRFGWRRGHSVIRLTSPLAYSPSSSHFSLLAPCRRHQKYIAQIMLSAYLSAPGVLLAQGATAAKNSAHAPAFDTSASGIPIVNINAPSAKGVSRNEYDQLNVEKKGLIFNNATDITNTELAGYIDGNARLGGKSASIILNEVTGNSRSALNGYLEIAGQSAEMVIANQNGITCNGCGFINTTRATLTTGQVLFDGAGGLSGFDVSQGDIAITGDGLNDTQTRELDILARSVQLNAKLWADQATIITGDNRINYQDKSVTARSNDERETFALDVAAIGGMYANRIHLIGTERGLGVNLNGEVKAVEDMTLDTQGNIVHRATLSADEMQIQANAFENSGEVLANRINIKTTKGLVSSGADAAIQATESIRLEAQALKNQAGAKLLSQNGDIHLIADSLTNQGTIAGHTLTVTTDTLNNTGENSQIFAAEQLTLTTTGDLRNDDQASIASDKALTITAQGQLDNLTGAIESLATLDITASSLSNTGKIQSQNDALTLTTGLVDNRGTLVGKGITINANELNNRTANGQIYSTDNLDLTLLGDFVNTDQALMHSEGNLRVEAQGNLTNHSVIESVAAATLNSKTVTNNGRIVTQNQALTMTADSLNNKGMISGHGVSVTAGSIVHDTSASKLLSTGDLTLNTDQDFYNQNGATIKANNLLSLETKGHFYNQSSFESDNDIHIIAQQVNNNDNGEIFAENGTLDIDASASLSNTGGIAANKVDIDSASLSNNGSNALILGRDDLSIVTHGDINNENGGVLYSFNSGNLTTDGTLLNSSSTIETGGDLTINANKLVNKKRVFSVKQNVNSTTHNGVSIARPSGYYNAKRNYTQTVTSHTITADSDQAYLLTGGNLTINAYIDNLYSTISAGKNLTFNSAKLNNVSSVVTNRNVKTGTDYLYRKWKECKRTWYGKKKCKTKYETKTRGYNSASSSNQTLAAATFTANGTISGKAGEVNNVGSVEAVSGSTADGENDSGFNENTFGIDKEKIGDVTPRKNDIFQNMDLDDIIESALFSASQNPDSGHLIETNPLFTNYKTFVSSDYMLNKMTGDGQGRTGKTASRLGDGYLEQQLVRQQILSYTGQQTLPDQADIEKTYATLMDNALDEYENLQLSAGVELSAGQVAKLKQPIVWMVTKTIQTPSGPQQALVPRVYFPNTWDMKLRPDGSLIAANNIDIQVDNEVVNSGAMMASVDMSLQGDNITNRGSIKAGGNANLIANKDITNSGSMQANGTLSLVAGGNITSETQSQTIKTQSGAFASTQTLVGQTASLSGGNISLNAGNNINLIASDVKADNEVLAQAGNNFTLASLAVTDSNRARNDYDESSTEHQVSSLSASSLQLSAGNTFTSQGAQLAAQEDLTLAANNIDLLAVKDTKDAYSFVGRGGNTTEKRNHNESITGTDLSAGGALTLVSQNDIFSKGSTLSSGEDLTIAAGGDVVLATETAHNSSYQQVKTKTSSTWGSSKRSTTTTSSESLTNQGTTLNSGGGLNIVSGADVLLVGSKASAEGDISVQAAGDIELLSAVDQSSQRYQQQKKGTFKVKAKDQGSIKQTAVTSDLIGGGNISLDSGSNITLEGATLAAKDTLSIGTDAVTQNANGQYVNDKGELAGNVTVTTQALESSEWSESSSSFRGVFKDLAKGLAVVASVGTAGLVHGEIKVGESDATRTDTLSQQTTTLAAADLDLKAQQDLTLIGAQVAVSDTANLTAQNVTIDAAQERTVTSTSHTDQTVSGEGASFSSEKGELTLASVTETDRTERTTTTANTWAGSNLQAGNLNIKADKNVAIIASDVSVQNDASIEGENVLIGGREDTNDTTNDSITKTKTLTVGVKNAYADTYLAVRALDQAKDAVKDAKAAYEEAKQKVADGKLPKNDLDFYKANLAVATANVASATTAVTSAGATAAASTATYGFTINGGVTTQTDTTSTTSSQGTWNGSNINVGGNTRLTSDNNLNIEGSNVATGGQLALNAQNINITAGKNTLTESTESHSEGVNASYGITNGSVSGGVNANQSSSDSQSVTHINSQLVAGSLVSDSDNLTIAGGNLDAASIDITTDQLVVTSLQDTSSNHSESIGGNIGVGGDGINNVGVNASQSEAERAWVAQQSGITGGQVKITAKDTSLTGAVLASVNAQGEDNGQLTLTTDTLRVSDIKDIDESKNLGISLSGGGDTTNIGANFDGYEKAQTTKATIGLGNVTLGGSNIDDQAQFADLNRDISNSQEITKDVERGGLDANLTVDNRMLTESGRDEIAEDILKTDMLVDTAVLAATTDRVGVSDFNEELGKTHTVYETVKAKIADDKILAGKLQDPSLSAQEKELMLNKLTHSVMQSLGYETEGYDNRIIADETATGTYEDGTGGKVAGFHSNETRDSYINDVNIDSTEVLVNAAGHESAHEMDAQDGNHYSQSDNEAYANNFGSNLADYTNLALDINGYDSGMASTNEHVGNTSHYVKTNTAQYKGLDKEQGDNWNLMHVDMNPWHAPEAVDRAWVQPVKNFPKDVKRAVHGIDGKDLLKVGNRVVTVGTMVAPQRVGWSILGAAADTAEFIMTGDWLNFIIPNIGGSAIKNGLKRTGINDNTSERVSHLSSNEIKDLLSEGDE